jgi:hypothetical protein
MALSSLQKGNMRYEEISGCHIPFPVIRAFAFRNSAHMDISGYDNRR